ncbi:efflux RND transporter periplasmic adaptor subunit [candidate division KSB1 bacterium]|nr:efflux RND transporter periplasmic adaptor subunit [candidate division KSB1 bacterium]
MKKILSILIFGVLLMGCGREDVEIDTSVTVPVSVEDVKLKSIEEFIETTGTARALQEVELSAETDGYYRLGKNARGKFYTLGDVVNPADVIVHIDNPELENNTKIESQKLNLDISKSEFEKQQALYEKGGVTLRELKNAEQAFIDAQYNYDNAQIQLAKLKVQSPFRGIIVDLPYFTPGTRISTNALVAKVMNYARLYMDVSYPAKHLGRIEVDQMVRALNYTMTDDTLNGRVTQVSPAIDSETRTFKASIEINNPEWKFRPGMFIKVETVVAHKDSAIVIPKSIIIQSRGARRVYVVDRGVAHGRRIVTGLENPTQVEVIEGLQVDDRLIVKGYETLSDQTKVRIIR